MFNWKTNLKNFPEVSVSDCAIVWAFDVPEGRLCVDNDVKVDGGLPGVVVLHVLQVRLDAPVGHRTNDEKDNDHRRDNEGGQLDGQIHFFVLKVERNTKKFFPEQFRFDCFVFYSMSSWFGRCSWQPFSVVVTIAKPGL